MHGLQEKTPKYSVIRTIPLLVRSLSSLVDFFLWMYSSPQLTQEMALSPRLL